MSESSWYETIAGESLLQGDLLLGCPVTTMIGPWTFPIDRRSPDLKTVETDLVVMTQSCDLENEKTDSILVSHVNNWTIMVETEYRKGNTAIRSRDFRRKLIEGNVPGLSLLQKNEGEPKLDWSVVDFHRLYTLPKSFLEQYAKSLGPRLRLRSPYREPLAQAFARYFMRVGLPHDAKAFEKEGNIAIPT